MDKYESRRIKAELRKILLREWDPIGVSDIPEAQDEYDAYLGDLLLTLRDGIDAGRLASHLRRIEIEFMGLGGRDDETLLPVARSLIQTYEAATANRDDA